MDVKFFNPDQYQIILTCHAALGLIALVVGLIPMFTQKGGKAHNFSGLVYFWAMIGVFFTAMPMCIAKSNLFLGSIAIFSVYMCFTGYRFTKLKPGKSANWVDKIISIITLFTSLGMLGLGVYLIVKSESVSAVGIILSVFGTICLLMSVSDLRRYFSSKKAKSMDWFFNHLGRMIGSYIAAVTAFAVQNSPIKPSIINWLGPTVVGTIAIVLVIRHFKKKMS